MKLCHPGVVVVDRPLLVSAAQKAGLGVPCQTVDSRLVGLHSTNKLGNTDVPELYMYIMNISHLMLCRFWRENCSEMLGKSGENASK